MPEPNLGSERAAGWSVGWSAYRGPPQTTTLGASDALHQTTAPSDPPPKPTHSQMNHLPASSRNPAGSRVRAAAHERLSGRSRSLRVDRSTIKSPTPRPGPCTQIRQGVRGAITIGSRPTRNHSPPGAQLPVVRRRHDVQIRRGPPSSGQLQSQISGASGQPGGRLGGRSGDERPTDHPEDRRKGAWDVARRVSDRPRIIAPAPRSSIPGGKALRGARDGVQLRPRWPACEAIAYRRSPAPAPGATQLRLVRLMIAGSRTKPPGQSRAACRLNPRKIPDRTALPPARQVTMIERVPPAATLIGSDTHAPWLKSLESSTLWPLTVMTSRRPAESQSSA